MTNSHSQPRVLAIVVTHNRCTLLQRCVTYLQQQTVMPDILIINNQSTDGTEAYLAQNGVPHITQENSGSAGGWWRGIDEGTRRGYDYVWMMDDDGFPDPRALETLLGLTDHETICLSSTPVKEDAQGELVFGLPVLNSAGHPIVFARKRKYDRLAEFAPDTTRYPHIHPFNGALINLNRIAPVGNIDRSYFMFGDEVDFLCRMKKAGKVYSALKALHYHPDVSRRTIDKKKVYYFIRNTIILNHLYYDKAIIRDLLCVGVALLRIWKRNGVGSFFSYIAGRDSKFVYQGIADGVRGRKINKY
jgi:rhamnopyranosyl-N-acetylglucosaminyl-diphospho-decaprenol beta-1,3/1,4-galactofuranosyltransferase